MSVATFDLEAIQQTEQDRQLPLYAKREIALVRGEGAYLYDSEGRRYLDAMSNYGVAVLGHADPGFAAALTDGLAALATGGRSVYSGGRGARRGAVAESAAPGVTRAFFSNSGSEAIEAALKFAR